MSGRSPATSRRCANRPVLDWASYRPDAPPPARAAEPRPLVRPARRALAPGRDPVHPGLGGLPGRRPAALHRLDPVLPGLGDQGPLPRRAQQRGDLGAGAQPVRRRAADARPDRGASTGSPPAVSSASSRPTGSATTSRCTPTRRAPRCSPRCTGCASRASTATGSPNKCLSDFVAPKETGIADHVGAFSVTAGLGIEERLAGVQGRPRRLLGDPARVARRPAGRGVRRAPAREGAPRAVGLRPRRAPRHGRADPREVPRHPARAGLPGLPRAHREGDADGAPRRRGAHRHPAHRVDGDVAGRVGVAAGTSRTPTASTSSSAGSGATRSSRMPRARAGTCAPPSAGSARTSATSPRTEARGGVAAMSAPRHTLAP